MRIMKTMISSFISPLDAIEKWDLREGGMASLIIVLLTSLSGSILLPVSYYLYYRNRFDITLKAVSLPAAFALSIATWLAASIVFWGISKHLKKNLSFKKAAVSWGFSYIPNLLCIIAYGLIQVFYNSFIGKGLTAVLINTFFIMLLIWKTIYYFIEMKFVLKLNLSEVILTTLVSGTAFIILMGIGFMVGIQIPMV